MFVGVLGSEARVRVDDAGAIDAGGVTVRWWVGADDGWHDPEDDTTTRVRRPGVAPSYEVAVRVPSGDFLERVYAVPTASGRAATAIDFANTSRAPCSVAAFVGIDGAGRVRLDGNVLRLDDVPVLTFASPPRLWTAGTDARERVRAGRVRPGEAAEWDAPAEVALLAPVPHRTVLRTAVSSDELDVRALPDPAAVEDGWRRQLDRGLRVELPAPLQEEVDARRADLLLAPPSARALAALEDWGFDTEAVAMWQRLGFRARRAARRRRSPADATGPAAWLLDLRGGLARERKRDVELLPGFRTEWLGQSLAVHDLPLRAGRLSFAVRWHGARPALLWDAPAGVTLRAPALDPDWTAPGGAGETLLAEPPAPLLALGSRRREGERVDDPGSFG
jgi:hypothetical protein